MTTTIRYADLVEASLNPRKRVMAYDDNKPVYGRVTKIGDTNEETGRVDFEVTDESGNVYSACMFKKR
jgi:hypothetical protein